jgi:tRNA nucleotidyltransferase (CCA-adding enzyme)
LEVILTHNNADFDAIASQLAAHKLNPQALPILPLRLNRNVAEFLALYKNGLPYVAWRDVKIRKITHITLTDTQVRPNIRGASPTTPTLIIEHHPQERPLAPHETWRGEIVGATTTLLVEDIQAQHIPLSTLEATVMMLGIYSDTGMLTYGGTTVRDVRAVAWLMEQGAVLDTVRKFLTSPLDDTQQALFQTLLQHAETRMIHGYAVSMCHAAVPHTVDGINSIAHRLKDVLDPTALFVMVEMPRLIQLVCRSADDALNVGEVAKLFGGGGHPRASAAAIEGVRLDALKAQIWAYLVEHVVPMVRVGDLMSYGVQTVRDDESIKDLLPRIHRIGHEGYPVLNAEGRVVGLLTRRDADRAIEHGLSKAIVGEVMQAGEVSLSPDDGVSALEQLIVNSGWGQIPVVENGKLLGIVTRTDLIKHWAKIHPSTPTPQPHISDEQLTFTLGHDTARLVQIVVEVAQSTAQNVYLVGGVVRDLLLRRSNADVDFVVEGDGIAFARTLCTRYGGELNSFAPFGTAKWLLSADTADRLGLTFGNLPHHLDFATARNEFYTHPTALPTVYRGSIKLDLGRRDFTLNTLAVQISPPAAYGRILDYYGGLTDLEAGLIRVLHSLSFVDDPTRILRAVRFSHRLGFTIEARTEELIQHALPMLGRVTGERVRNELTLLFNEHTPEEALVRLLQMGVLEAIHPHFAQLDSLKLRAVFARVRQPHPEWTTDTNALYWHVLMANLSEKLIQDVGERLLIGQNTLTTMRQAAYVAQHAKLGTPDARPSELVALLEHRAPIALLTAWLIRDDDTARAQLSSFVTTWQHVKSISNGHTLKQMGLAPSAHYRRILSKLRQGWLDGTLQTAEQEQAMLNELTKEAQRDDP